MNEKTTSVQIGPGFFGTLTILFIGLKLTGHIDWSWWWVLSPIWLFFVGLVALGFVVALLEFLVGADK